MEIREKKLKGNQERKYKREIRRENIEGKSGKKILKGNQERKHRRETRRENIEGKSGEKI